MKLIKNLTLILAVLFTYNSANAQFRSLAKGLKSKPKSKKELKLDWSVYKQTPAITLHSLLNNTIVNEEEGTTAFEFYTSTFVTDKKMNGEKVHFTREKAKYLKIELYVNGEYVTYYEMSEGGRSEGGKQGYFAPSDMRYKRSNGKYADEEPVLIKNTGVGMYRLDFYAGDKMFYSFDFEVYKLTNNDSYADLNEMYLTRGPWNKYAYVHRNKSDNFIFGMYLNHEEFFPNPADGKKTTKYVNWEAKLFKNNELYADYGGKNKLKANVARARWKEFKTGFSITNAEKRTYLKFSDLTDAKYKIEVTIEGETKPREYSFEVVNNKIVLIEQQDRSKNSDPTRLIEGWDNYFWMELEK